MSGLTSYTSVFSKYLMKRMSLDNALFLSLFYLTYKLSGVNRLLAKVTFGTDLQNFYTNVGNCSGKAARRGWGGVGEPVLASYPLKIAGS